MGQIGRWIDSRSDEGRDRIIEHPDPTYRGEDWWDEQRDCGCLVGCVVGREYEGSPYRHAVETGRRGDPWAPVGFRFPQLTKRFGAPRMWRVVKARAAKGNQVEVRALAATPTEATPDE